MNKKGCSNCESLRTENYDLKVKLMKLNSVDLNEQKLIAYHNIHENAKIIISSLSLEVIGEVSDKIKKAIDEFEEFENQIDIINYAFEQPMNFIEIEEYHNESQFWSNSKNNYLKRQHISGIESINSTTHIPETQNRISSTEIQTTIFDNPTLKIENPDSLSETLSG